MKKVVVLLLVCTLCFAICGCTAVDDVRQEVAKVENFVAKAVSIATVESPEMALELVKRGWYISLSGVVSFKNAPKVKEVAAVVPRDRLLIETDAPYLTPHPFRGKTNRSDYLVYTLNAIAEARGEDAESLSEAIYHNSIELFNKKI